jgi:hypothetical protein
VCVCGVTVTASVCVCGVWSDCDCMFVCVWYVEGLHVCVCMWYSCVQSDSNNND